MREVELQDVAEIVAGQSPKSEFYNEDGEGVPFFQGKADFGKDYPTVTTWCTKPKKMAKKGDILFSVRAPVGPTNIADIDCCIGRGLSAIRPRDDIDRSFLRYYFKKVEKKISDRGRGSTFNSITQKDLKALNIPLPSLSEQKAIVAKLDRAQRLIDIDKEMLAKYDDLIQSVFLEMFGDPVTNPKGWEVKKLGKVCDVGSSKRVYVKELVDDGIPFYRGQEIGKLSEGESFEQEHFITKEHYQELIDHSGKPKIGDLLMPSICPDGRIYIIKDDKEFYFKDGRVLWVKSGESEINSFYLRYHLKALFQANYSEIASGTTFEELKIFALRKLEILIPPAELQYKFQIKIEQINKEIERSKQSSNKSEELFSSLVQGAFGHG